MSAQLTAQHIYTLNYIRPNNVSPHVLSPPPFTAYTGEQLQLALERRNANTSTKELLTPSSCRRGLLQQRMLVMSKPPDVRSTKQLHVLWSERQNDPPHTCSRLQILQDHRLDVTLCCQEAETCELTIMKLQLFPYQFIQIINVISFSTV